MLVDTRFQGKSTIPDVSPFMSWTKRSVKIYASVNQMFAYNHAYHIWYSASRASAAHLFKYGLKKPSKMFPTVFSDTDDVRNFIRFLSKVDEDDFTDLYKGWLSRRWGAKQLNLAEPHEFKKHLKSLKFNNRVNMPSIASSIDAFQRIFSVAEILTSINENESKWTAGDIGDVAWETMHFADATARLMGAAGKTAFKYGFAPIVGVVDFGRYTFKSIDAILADDPYKATCHAVQAVASAGVTSSLYIAGTATVSGPAGYVTIPWYVVVGGVSAVLYLGAEVALWIDENLNERYEVVARILWDKIQTDEMIIDNFYDLAQTPIRVNKEFRAILDEYWGVKEKWAGKKVENRKLSNNISDLDYFKDSDGNVAFPDARWRYLEKGEESAKEEYELYCTNLARKLGIIWPDPNTTQPSPPPFPFSRPEPFE